MYKGTFQPQVWEIEEGGSRYHERKGLLQRKKLFFFLQIEYVVLVVCPLGWLVREFGDPKKNQSIFLPLMTLVNESPKEF